MIQLIDEYSMQKLKILLLFFNLGLVACAPQPPKILTEGKTIKEIYADEVRSSSSDFRENISRGVNDDGGDLDGFTRSSQNELEHLFPLLPNPKLCMYVWPHFGGEGFPVPGYTTCFNMYARDEYALPGEAY